MPLHKSQQTNLDYLLDPSIIEYCKFDRFNLKLRLSATAVDQRWPSINIWMNDKLITDLVVTNGSSEFEYNTIVDACQDQIVLEIEYHGKTNDDTVADPTGKIVQNQSVTIEQILVNNVDIIETNIIYQLGNYTAELSQEKREYYIKHGYSIEPSQVLTMYENGRWKLKMSVPVLTGFVKMITKQESHEKWPDSELLNNIIDTVKNIKNLERKIKEQS